MSDDVMCIGRKRWFETIVERPEQSDPDANGRVKGLCLVAVFALATTAGRMTELAIGASPSLLAGDIMLWASVHEARVPRIDSSRDLPPLCLAGALVVFPLRVSVAAPSSIAQSPQVSGGIDR